MVKLGLFGGDSSIEESLQSIHASIRAYWEGHSLTDNPSLRNFARNLATSWHLSLILVASPLNEWNPNEFVPEQAVVDGIEFYQVNIGYHPVLIIIISCFLCFIL